MFPRVRLFINLFWIDRWWLLGYPRLLQSAAQAARLQPGRTSMSNFISCFSALSRTLWAFRAVYWASLVLAWGLVCVPAESAVTQYYVAQRASGASDGSSCANANSVTFFNTASNWGSQSTIGPGTTVHLCGTFTGTTGSTLLTVQGNGASGNPITLLFEPGAMLTAPAWSPNGAIQLSGHSYITVDGGSNGVIQNTLNGSPGGACSGGPCSLQQTSAAIRALPCNNCEIRNLTISNIYVHTPCRGTGACDTSIDQTMVNAIVFRGSNVLIHDNTIHDVGWALFHQYLTDSNIQIYNNNIYNFDHGWIFAGNGPSISNVLFHDNHLHDMDNWDTGSANTYHHDGIHAFGPAGPGNTVNGLAIYNNLFDGNEGQCCVTAWIYLEGNSGSVWANTSSGPVYIFNNIFVGSLDLGNGQLAFNAGSSYELYNNTFLVNPSSGSTGSCTRSYSPDSSSANLRVTAKNNAYSGCNNMISMDGKITSILFSNNAYASQGSGGNPAFSWAGHSSTSSLSTWQSQTNQDTNSAANLVGTLGVSTTGVPQSGSMVVGLGANLSGLCAGPLAALCTDMGGASRPSSGEWDAGAYVYGSSGTTARPNAPTALTVTVK